MTGLQVLLIVVTLVGVIGWRKWMRADDALDAAQVRIVRLESRVLTDVPTYEQMRQEAL